MRTATVHKAYFGKWWTPEEPTPRQGTLHLGTDLGGNLVEVSLICDWELGLPAESHALHPIALQLNPRILPVIFGTTQNGHKFSLFNVSTADFEPLALIEGAHFDYRTATVKEVSTKLPSFAGWLHRGAEQGPTVGANEIKIPFSKEAATASNREGVEVSIMAGVQYRRSDELQTMVTSTANYSAKFSKPVLLRTAMDFGGTIYRLLSLLAGTPVSDAGVVDFWLGDDSRAKFMRIHGSNPESNGRLSPLHGSETQPFAELSGILKRWLDWPEELKTVASMVSALKTRTSYALEADFMEACRIAESTARAFSNQNLLSVPKTGSRFDFQQSVNAVLLTGQDPELAKSFTGQEPEMSLPSSTSGISAFIKNVRRTRDTLTHVFIDGAPEGRILQMQEMRSATNTLLFASLALVLRHLHPKPRDVVPRLTAAYTRSQRGALYAMFE